MAVFFEWRAIDGSRLASLVPTSDWQACEFIEIGWTESERQMVVGKSGRSWPAYGPSVARRVAGRLARADDLGQARVACVGLLCAGDARWLVQVAPLGRCGDRATSWLRRTVESRRVVIRSVIPLG